MAQSSAVRVSGPAQSSVKARGKQPLRDRRPYVGFSPNRPCTDAGKRMEPPVSLPSEPNTAPLATAAPEPLDDPPEILEGSKALQQSPKDGFWPVGPATISFRFRVPIVTAPASFKR